jgi:hypothetical protein
MWRSICCLSLLAAGLWLLPVLPAAQAPSDSALTITGSLAGHRYLIAVFSPATAIFQVGMETIGITSSYSIRAVALADSESRSGQVVLNARGGADVELPVKAEHDSPLVGKRVALKITPVPEAGFWRVS